MSVISRRTRRLGLAAAIAVCAVAGFNASPFAPEAQGRPVLLAQRGVHQVFDEEGVDAKTCTARRLKAVEHGFIDNSLPSIAAAFAAGADIVEVDVRQARGGEFVLFHDAGLECRTQGKGRVFDADLASLKALDIGYGYSADGGRTFPLRGKGVGMMPSLAEALAAFPRRRFMIQIKGAYREEGEALVRYLERGGRNDWSRLVFFGAPVAVDRLQQLRPRASTWTDKKLIRCTVRYLAIGWTGHVPEACRDGMIAVPLNRRYALWGWPNRFIARMNGADVGMLALDAKGAGFIRIDTAAGLSRLPPGYNGYVWTDRIETVGPAKQQRPGG